MTERRELNPDKRTLSDADLEAIITALQNVDLTSHVCRLSGVNQKELQDAIKFHQHVNMLMDETGSTIRKTVLVVGITGLLSLLILGLYAKIKDVVGGP